jgi:hypothetical protein
MRTLQDYLIESSRQYEYRIKIAGELTQEQIEKMEHCFAKFDMVSLSEPRRTPVTADPLGFEGIKNEEINIMDVKFNYPASTQQFTEIAKDAGIAGNKIIVINKAFNDSMQDEEANKDRTPEGGSLLDSDLPDDIQTQVDANKLYSTPSAEQDVIKNAAKTEFEVAGGKTDKAVTTNDLPMNNTSPFSGVKLPDRPKTGAKS